MKDLYFFANDFALCSNSGNILMSVSISKLI